MRVLHATEIEVINGAGRIQDFCANLGGQIGESLTGLFIQFAPKINLPIIGSAAQDLVNDLITQVVKGVFENIGASVGGKIEDFLPFNW